MAFVRNTQLNESSPVASADCHVVIAMAMHNGCGRLPQQLDSFRDQSHANWSLVASDDGSTDASKRLVAEFGAGLDRNPVVCLAGPCRGYAENFLSVLRRMPPGDCWLAFSDQDDVWTPDRLERGVQSLRDLPAGTPGLYCSRTMICDDELRPLRLSAPRPRAPGFRNALVQNIAAGNTILLNPAAAALVREAAAEAGRVIAHDWWVYQIVSGAGGTVVHDDEPTVQYRQHDGNQIGANDGARARLRRFRMILSGEYRRWNDVNVAALYGSAARLTPENRALLADFDRMRRAPLAARLRTMRRLGLYRQTRLSTMALWAAALLGRL